MEPKYTANQYAQVLRNLLPRGRAWNREDGSVQASVLDGLAKGAATVDAAAMSLLEDAFPATAVFLLPEWERTLGLPDPCAGEAPTLQVRQAQVAARLVNSGGQSAPFYIDYAASLGYQILIKEMGPFRMGASSMGTQLGGPDWAHAWTVQSDRGLNTVSFRMGRSAMGEPLEVWGDAVLECEFNGIRPAHTVVIFTYPLLGADATLFELDSSALG